MSTRTNIHFCSGPGDVRANVYRHYDGYPGRMLADLDEFFRDVSRLTDKRFGDPQYLAAKFVVWQADRYARGAGRHMKNSPLDFLGVGICLRDHDDIEYVYEIVCDGGFGTWNPPIVRWRPAGFHDHDPDEWNTWRAGQPIPE